MKAGEEMEEEKEERGEERRELEEEYKRIIITFYDWALGGEVSECQLGSG